MNYQNHGYLISSHFPTSQFPSTLPSLSSLSTWLMPATLDVCTLSSVWHATARAAGLVRQEALTHSLRNDVREGEVGAGRGSGCDLSHLC